MLSHLLIEKRLMGEWKEATLIPSQGRVLARVVLLVGLGKRKEYSYLRVRELSSFLLETLRKLNVSHVCLSLPYEEATNVDCGKLVEILIEGMGDCLNLDRFQWDDEWIKGLRLFFAEGEERFNEVLLGIQTAKSILEGRLEIRIFVPSEETPDLK